MEESIAAYKAVVSAGSSEMQRLVEATGKLLGAAPAAEAWLAYVASAAAIVATGLTDMLLVSLRYLLSQASLLFLFRCPLMHKTTAEKWLFLGF